MDRLSGLDAGFLALELPAQSMNGMLLAILRPASDEAGPKPLSLEHLRDHVRQHLRALPSFHCRVVRVPLDLSQPVLVSDPDFRLEDHIAEVTLPSPGGSKELDRVCAEEAGRPLDQSRPLWRIVLVHGLSDGRQAVLLKIHHCMADGMAGMTTFSELFYEHPERQGSEPFHPADRLPSRFRLTIDAIGELARLARRFPRFFTRSLSSGRAAKDLVEKEGIRVPNEADTPHCLFNQGFTSERGYARTRLPLDDVVRIKNAAGVTVNDVVLTAVSEAAKRYLTRREALPREPLTAIIFLGLDSSDAPHRQWGNRIANMTTSLCTDIDDPWQRLQQVHKVTALSKQWLHGMGESFMADGLDFVPPWLARFFVKRTYNKRFRHPERAGHNVIVSNFRGFTSPGTALGAVEELYFSGPPNLGVGVNVTVWSYLGQLMVAVTTIMDSVDEPQELADAIAISFADLVGRSESNRLPA